MEAQPLTWAVHHLAVAVAEFDASVARRLGLSAGDYLALKHLLAAAGPVEFADPPGPVELGRLLGLSSGAATGLVDRLERAGYARREPHPATAAARSSGPPHGPRPTSCARSNRSPRRSTGSAPG